MIFASLFFSEMIIINKWGLNENTKKESLIREKQELEKDNRISELINGQEDKFNENEEKEKNEEISKYTNN